MFSALDSSIYVAPNWHLPRRGPGNTLVAGQPNSFPHLGKREIPVEKGTRNAGNNLIAMVATHCFSEYSAVGGRSSRQGQSQLCGADLPLTQVIRASASGTQGLRDVRRHCRNLENGILERPTVPRLRRQTKPSGSSLAFRLAKFEIGSPCPASTVSCTEAIRWRRGTPRTMPRSFAKSSQCFRLLN